eukprot:4655950-Prymnesium_polylepis.1
MSAREAMLLEACDAHRKPSDVGLLRQLLNEGGNSILESTDGTGRTPLILAAMSGADVMLEILLDSGADVHA